jgi:hypothetical protein
METVSVVILSFSEVICIDELIERLGKVFAKDASQAEILKVLQ